MELGRKSITGLQPPDPDGNGGRVFRICSGNSCLYWLVSTCVAILIMGRHLKSNE